jgi:hypothetical protein
VDSLADVDFKDEPNNQCPKKWQSGASDPRSGWQILLALSGNIKDDGNFVHRSIFRGQIRPLLAPRDPNEPFETRDRVWFAQLVSNGADRGGERDDCK